MSTTTIVKCLCSAFLYEEYLDLRLVHTIQRRKCRSCRRDVYVAIRGGVVDVRAETVR